MSIGIIKRLIEKVNLHSEELEAREDEIDHLYDRVDDLERVVFPQPSNEPEKSSTAPEEVEREEDLPELED